jgi:hypothetical protein
LRRWVRCCGRNDVNIGPTPFRSASARNSSRRQGRAWPFVVCAMGWESAKVLRRPFPGMLLSRVGLCQGSPVPLLRSSRPNDRPDTGRPRETVRWKKPARSWSGWQR